MATKIITIIRKTANKPIRLSKPTPDSFNKVKTTRIAKLTNTNTITFPILFGLFNFVPTLKVFQHALFYIIILNLSIFTIAHILPENILIFLKIHALSQNFS